MYIYSDFFRLLQIGISLVSLAIANRLIPGALHSMPIWKMGAGAAGLRGSRLSPEVTNQGLHVILMFLMLLGTR